MIRPQPQLVAERGGIPRESGDDPSPNPELDFAFNYSPRERG